MEQRPSSYDLERWLFAYGPEYEVELEVEPGKFLIFRSEDEIDELWEKAKQATEEGLLGYCSKVSTAYASGYDPSSRVICVYCSDSYDENEKQRVRDELRELGVYGKLPYKTNKQSLYENGSLPDWLVEGQDPGVFEKQYYD